MLVNVFGVCCVWSQFFFFYVDATTVPFSFATVSNAMSSIPAVLEGSNCKLAFDLLLCVLLH